MKELRGFLTNPWGKARFLWVVGIGYVVWTMVPVVFAVVMSFNSTRSVAMWASPSLRWWTGDPFESLLHDPGLRHSIVQSLRLSSLAVVISIPLGVSFALALDRWHGRIAGGTNVLMMISFITPELILAVALFLLFTEAFRFVRLGTTAQLLGLVVLAVAYPVVIVRARLLSMGPEYEQAAMDLGATPVRALYLVTLPLLGPAILASAAIVFAFTLDDFVMVNQLAVTASNQTVAMFIYGAARTSPTPAANAVGTLMLVSSSAVILIAFLLYRRSSRRAGVSEGGTGAMALGI